MKYLVSHAVLFISFVLLPPQAWQTYGGRLSFTSVQGMAMVEGISPHTLVKWNIQTGEFVFKTQVTAFAFSNCSRQVEKMFNDVYMESHKYHWIAFKGTTSTVSDLSAGKYHTATATGEMDIRGIKVRYDMPLTVGVDSSGHKKIQAKFDVAIKNHQIPKISSHILTLSDTLHFYLVAEM